MKDKVFKLLCSLSIISLFLLTTTTIKADSIPTEATDPYILLDTSRGVALAVSEANSHTQSEYGFTMVVVSEQTDSCRVILNMTEYNKLTTSQKTTIMIKLLDGIKSSSMNSRDLGRLYSFVENIDTSVSRIAREFSSNTTADLSNALSFISPGLSPISILLGIIIILGFVLFSLQFGVDLIYCTLPLSHPLFIRKAQSQNGRWVRFASSEAESAYANYTTGATTQTPIVGLVKGRLPSLVIFSIFAAVVLTGKFFVLTGWVMDFVDNALRVFT